MSTPVTDLDYDAFVTRDCVRHDLTYQAMPWPDLVDQVRTALDFATRVHPYARFDFLSPSPMGTLGQRIHARWSHSVPGHFCGRRRGDCQGVQVGPPLAGLAHRNYEFPVHTDKTNPYKCINATCFFRHDCTGGHVVFPASRVGVDAKDGWVLLFDAQQAHGVTGIVAGPGGWRIGLTFYLPVLS